MLYKSLLHCSKRYSLLTMLLLFFSVFASAEYETHVNPSSSAGSVKSTKNSDGSVSLMPSPNAGYVFSYYRSSVSSDGGYNWTYLGQKTDVPVKVSATIVSNTHSLYSYTFYFTKSSTTYTLTVKSNNTAYGTVSGGGTYAINASATIKATPKTGYKFVKWNDGNTSASRTITVTKNATYTATFEPLKYTITWKNSDGTTLKTEQVNYGTTPSYTGTTPTKASTAQYTYTFSGWTPSITSVTGDKTYTATYSQTLRQYSITWKNADGTTLKTEQVAYGATPSYTGTTPTKDATAEYTYTFAGWSPEVVSVTGDAIYTATYTATKNSYTITWLQDDGTTIDETTIEYGEVPTHEDPTKPATAEYTYTFAGWSPKVVAVTGDATYTATYTATKNSYTITWKQDDGTTIDETTVEYGEVPTHEDPTKDATAEYTYTFAGWSPEVVSVTGDAIYTATYIATKIIYDIDVTPEDDAEGTVDIEGEPTYGSAITLTATPNECYHFVRWSDGNTDNPRSVVVEGDISLKAIFEQDGYTITWQNTDGRTLETDDILCGETPTYDSATPTQADSYNYHYTFSGWEPEIVPAAEDATYTAVYDSTALIPNADNCIECQNAPVVALYDYLLMLNVKSLKEQGYNFTVDDAKWYRVRGELDNLDLPLEQRDDELVVGGFYLTIAQNLSGTGNYYVVVDMSKTISTSLCTGLMRSALINYNAAPARHSVALSPNIIRGAGMMTLSGLLPEENTTIAVYDPTGRLVHTFTTTGTNEYKLTAAPQPGCYHVRVESETLQTTLKYVIYNE